MKYRIVWEIDIEASSHKEAAEEALKIQRDPESLATVFDVIGEDGNTVRIDLLDDEIE